MGANIIDLIKDNLGSTLVSQAASQLGESEAGITKAISGYLPIILGGFANNSKNSSLIDAIADGKSGGLLGNLLGNTSNNDMISTLLSSIFGEKIGGIASLISNYAGISNSSSNSLLNVVSGAILGTFGNYASDKGLNANGISSLLSDQKGIISSLVPAGLSLGSLGLGDWFSGSSQAASSASAGSASRTTSSNSDGNGSGGMGWLKWLLALLALALIAFFLFKKCNSDKEVVEEEIVIIDSIATDSDAVTNGDASSTDRTTQEIDLNGTKINAFAGGLESQIINFLNSGQYESADETSLKETWYTFDNVNFKMGSSTELEPGSDAQLNNLVAILKAFPTAKIKIGGYTDKTGNEENNKKLSQARADFIKDFLSKAGVGSQVSSAEGYGSSFATIPATASDEERAVDRKMAIRFTK